MTRFEKLMIAESGFMKAARLQKKIFELETELETETRKTFTHKKKRHIEDLILEHENLMQQILRSPV